MNIEQIMKSANPQQMILQMMNQQQRQLAEQFLKNPNREKALEELMKQYNISNQTINDFFKQYGINR